MLELARSLPAKVDGPDLRLALFDAEEAGPGEDFLSDGIRGSTQYVRYAARDKRRQGSPPLKSIEAMVLFDMVGDCDLELPRETSSDAGLYAAFADASEQADGEAAPFEGTANPVSDDHVPFLEQGIPALDLIDFAYRLRRHPGLLLAHARRHGRQGVRGEPRRGRRGRGAGPAGAEVAAGTL